MKKTLVSHPEYELMRECLLEAENKHVNDVGRFSACWLVGAGPCRKSGRIEFYSPSVVKHEDGAIERPFMGLFDYEFLRGATLLKITNVNVDKCREDFHVLLSCIRSRGIQVVIT